MVPLSEREVERRATIHLGISPDATAVTVGDSLHEGQGQTHSAALERIGLVQSLQNSEQLVLVTHVEPDAVVANEVHVAIAGSEVAGRRRGRATGAGDDDSCFALPR